MAKVLIENEGALFRGPARGLPDEVWFASRKQWAPYGSAPKPVDWGVILTPEEAKAQFPGAV